MNTLPFEDDDGSLRRTHSRGNCPMKNRRGPIAVNWVSGYLSHLVHTCVLTPSFVTITPPTPYHNIVLMSEYPYTFVIWSLFTPSDPNTLDPLPVDDYIDD